MNNNLEQLQEICQKLRDRRQAMEDTCQRYFGVRLRSIAMIDTAGKTCQTAEILLQERRLRQQKLED